MLTQAFWLSTVERAVKTFAQSLIAALTMSSAPLDVIHADWIAALSLAVGAAILSLLTSLSSIRVWDDHVPSQPDRARHLAP